MVNLFLNIKLCLRGGPHKRRENVCLVCDASPGLPELQRACFLEEGPAWDEPALLCSVFAVFL